MIKKAKNIVIWQTELYQKVFKVEKVINRKSAKLYVRWKGYEKSFNIV